MNNMTSFQIAVLLEEAIILNGLIAFGNAADKKKAKEKMEELLPILKTLAKYNSPLPAEGLPFL